MAIRVATRLAIRLAIRVAIREAIRVAIRVALTCMQMGLQLVEGMWLVLEHAGALAPDALHECMGASYLCGEERAPW